MRNSCSEEDSSVTTLVLALAEVPGVSMATTAATAIIRLCISMAAMARAAWGLDTLIILSRYVCIAVLRSEVEQGSGE